MVPIKPDPLSVIGLPLLERWLDEYTDDEGIKVDAVGLVFSLVRGPIPAVMRDVMTDLRSKRNSEIFQDYLSQSTDVARSVDSREPIFIHKRNCKTSRQIQGITAEFLKRTT